MKHLPKDFLVIGRAADFIVNTDDSILIISGGSTLEITTVLSKDHSAVVMRDPLFLEPDGRGETLLFNGTAAETMQAFLDIRARLSKPKRPPILASIHRLTVSVAAVAIVAALAMFFVETRQIAAEIAKAEVPAEQSSNAPNGVPDLSALGIDPASLQVLKRPDFLTPEQTTQSGSAPDTDHTSEAAPEKATNDSAEGAGLRETISKLNLPTFNPGIYTKPPETSQASTKTKGDAETKTDILAVKPAEGAVMTKDTAASVTSSPDTKTTDATAEKPVTAAGDAKKTDVPATASDAHDPAIAKNAQAAVQKLIGDGMSQDQIRKLLMDLQQLNAGGSEELTPEMLKALPEEVAALLADQGMDLQGPSGGTMNILPSETVDSFRGKDGIATIPENYSWYARAGGPISIPLPGGGDIKKPQDLLEFGLQP